MQLFCARCLAFLCHFLQQNCLLSSRKVGAINRIPHGSTKDSLPKNDNYWLLPISEVMYLLFLSEFFQNVAHILDRAVESRGSGGWAFFGRAVNPISTRGVRLLQYSTVLQAPSDF